MEVRRSCGGAVAAATASLVCAGVGLTGAALAGCQGKGPHDIVLTERRSPDGTKAAYVVERSGKAVGAKEYLLVLPTEELPLNRPDLLRVAPMEATGLYGLRVEWPAADAVRVVCQDCGMKAGSVTRQMDHAGGVRVEYAGFGGGATRG